MSFKTGFLTGVIVAHHTQKHQPHTEAYTIDPLTQILIVVLLIAIIIFELNNGK